MIWISGYPDDPDIRISGYPDIRIIRMIRISGYPSQPDDPDIRMSFAIIAVCPAAKHSAGALKTLIICN